jgi:pimeloyl-ACP methyl ester carboxylesterase
MAEDTVAYLEQVVTRPAHLVGWSDGAVVALLVARQRPDLVQRQVLIGQYYNFSGRVPDSPLDAFLESPEAIGFLRQGYDPVSPDGPDHFTVVHAKMMAMFARAADRVSGGAQPAADLGPARRSWAARVERGPVRVRLSA